MASQVDAALHALRREIAPLRDYPSDLDTITEIEEGAFDVRYLGHWVNPPEAENDEDYDWQILTPAAAKRIDQIVARYAARFVGVRLTWGASGEKNWIRFQAEEIR